MALTDWIETAYINDIANIDSVQYILITTKTYSSIFEQFHMNEEDYLCIQN